MMQPVFLWERNSVQAYHSSYPVETTGGSSVSRSIFMKQLNTSIGKKVRSFLYWDLLILQSLASNIANTHSDFYIELLLTLEECEAKSKKAPLNSKVNLCDSLIKFY